MHKIQLTANILAYKDLGEQQIHKMRVMGISPSQGYYSSVSDDGTLKCVHKNSHITDVTPQGPARKLKYLLAIPARGLFAVCDTLGNVLLYS